MKNLKNKWGGGATQLNLSAFTLAEVLITLGIIGIVAAMTLPTLIQKHNTQVIETKLKKFYTTMNQAITLSEVDNGPCKYWWDALSTLCPQGANSSFSEECLDTYYETYLKKYLKNVDSVSFKEKVSFQQQNVLQIYLADGSGFYLSYRGQDYQFFPNSANFKKKNKVRGIDYFVFGFYPNGENHPGKKFEPYVFGTWDGTMEYLKNNNSYAKIIQLNGWKIPDDYPLKL